MTPSIHFSGAGSHGSSSGGGGSQRGNHTVPIYLPEGMIRVWIISVGLSTFAGVMPAIKASRLLCCMIPYSKYISANINQQIL